GVPVNFYEVRLYEGQSRFDVFYGAVPNAGNSATVGVQDGLGHSTQFGCNAGGLNGGETLVFYCGPKPCGADINGDGMVNVADYLAFLALYAAADPRADVNGDGMVNVQDYLFFLMLYAAGCV